MALITCPECGNRISDKSEVCIHCGYPIAKENEKDALVKKQEQEANWENRNKKALQMKPEEEAIPLFLQLGDEGYLMGYLNAGGTYLNMGDYASAYECYMKAYTIDPDSCGGATAECLGYLHWDKNSPFFDTEKAINFCKRSKTASAYRLLGKIYNPEIENDGFEKYKDLDEAINYHEKLALCKNYPYLESVYHDLGELYCSSERYVFSACYFLLSLRIREDQITRESYSYVIKKVREKGSLWEENIQTIRSPEDIYPMIERVNEEIDRDNEEIRAGNSNNAGSPRCPTCGSNKIRRIGSLDRAASIMMWGLFSKKMGKQFECYNCGYRW